LLVFSIFSGLCSHIILDSFTPSGVKAFSPFSDREYHKKFGVILFLIMVIIFLLLFPNNIIFFIDFLTSFH
jgi:inner membrane protein